MDGIASARAPRVLVTDFDGTMTRRDFYRVALERLIDADISGYWRDFEEGRLTHFEALRRIFLHIRGGEPAVRGAMAQMDFDPGAADAIRRLRDHGWSVIVVSAGCSWYIERLLVEAGIAVSKDGVGADPLQSPAVALHANPGNLTTAGALEMRYPEESPFPSPALGVDKEAIVRAAARDYERVAFAGDGRPDYACAMLVNARDRFARGWLAKQLQLDAAPFQNFDRWTEIAAALLEE
jgi:HAD superfamily phosphoserine phosphatase-like hydrolase